MQHVTGVSSTNCRQSACSIMWVCLPTFLVLPSPLCRHTVLQEIEHLRYQYDPDYFDNKENGHEEAGKIANENLAGDIANLNYRAVTRKITYVLVEERDGTGVCVC
jgi:hypothetical protein